jgi:hypothetical protein
MYIIHIKKMTIFIKLIKFHHFVIKFTTTGIFLYGTIFKFINGDIYKVLEI